MQKEEVKVCDLSFKKVFLFSLVLAECTGFGGLSLCGGNVSTKAAVVVTFSSMLSTIFSEHIAHKLTVFGNVIRPLWWDY